MKVATMARSSAVTSTASNARNTSRGRVRPTVALGIYVYVSHRTGLSLIIMLRLGAMTFSFCY